MPRTLNLSGKEMGKWPGVRVWQRNQGQYGDITGQWSWSIQEHQHYEVMVLQAGSWWVPVSTSPPSFWCGNTLVKRPVAEPIRDGGRPFFVER